VTDYGEPKVRGELVIDRWLLAPEREEPETEVPGSSMPLCQDYLWSRVPQLLTFAAVGQDEVPPRTQPCALQYLSPSDSLPE